MIITYYRTRQLNSETSEISCSDASASAGFNAERGKGSAASGDGRKRREMRTKTQGEYAEEIRFYKSPPFFKLLRMTQGVFIILYQNRSKVKIIQNWGKKFKIATNLIFFEI